MTATTHGTDFGKTGAEANTCTYCPHIIKESIKVPKHYHKFNCENGYKPSKASPVYPQAIYTATIPSTD
jgi:hypothetical protein